ncbi:MAG: leucine-rich repeat domain-containing protein [Lachnospiraceae bacterium]|nr:leucine-rich repeat domain-containing protein [Lachnospiraceae bacterium]
MDKNQVYVWLAEADNVKIRESIVRKLIDETGLDHRTVVGLIKMYNNMNEDISTIFDKLLDEDFYTIENMLICYKNGLEDIIPVRFYECVNFVRQANITRLPDRFVEGDGTLNFFTILDSITEIGNGAFKDCRNLSILVTHDKITSIGFEAFKDCASLPRIKLSKSLEHIGDGAFSGCNKLSRINIPDKIYRLGDNTFNGCSSLVYVEMTHELDLGENTFKNCYNLREVFGEISYVGKNCFSGCTLLHGIELSAPLISYGAFKNCSELTDIVFDVLPLEIQEDAFLGCNSIRYIGIDALFYQLKEITGYIELGRHISLHPDECEVDISKSVRPFMDALDIKTKREKFSIFRTDEGEDKK